jgi:hypothetical protein
MAQRKAPRRPTPKQFFCRAEAGGHIGADMNSDEVEFGRRVLAFREKYHRFPHLHDYLRIALGLARELGWRPPPGLK